MKTEVLVFYKFRTLSGRHSLRVHAGEMLALWRSWNLADAGLRGTNATDCTQKPYRNTQFVLMGFSPI
jgi:hypothetical protein